jgi:hypothetical protein
MAMAGPACTTTPSSAQQASAVAFVNTTVTDTSRYRSLAAAKAAGYVPITPSGAAVVHYLNWSNLSATTPANVLNPSAPQSLVYANTPTGPRLVAAMYVMPNGSTATPPQPGGAWSNGTSTPTCASTAPTWWWGSPTRPASARPGPPTGSPSP